MKPLPQQIWEESRDRVRLSRPCMSSLSPPCSKECPKDVHIKNLSIHGSRPERRQAERPDYWPSPTLGQGYHIYFQKREKYAQPQRFQFILTLEWWMGQEENSGKRKADLGIRALSVG